MNSSDVAESAQHSTTTNGASLRPRTRRLISDLEDEPTNGHSVVRPSSAGLFTTSGRSTPRRHETFETTPASSSKASGSAFRGLAGTWSQLSGFAVGVISGGSRNSSPRRRNDTRDSLPTSPKRRLEWGPQLQHNDIGAGTSEGRAELIRDAKRKALLSGDGDVNPTTRHKRRTSDDITAAFTSHEESDSDSLVYVHHVKAGDTLPGISIKYNCQATVLRQANRIWPNDPIQSRKLIYIPVDASAVKGKQVPGPNCQIVEEDLLGDYTEDLMQHESPQLSRSPKFGASAFEDSAPVPLSPSSASNNTEMEYKHESWVLLPNDKQPTEIARLLRQNLGFFPRTRRKSVGFSDRSTSRNTSFDLGRAIHSSPLIRPQDPPSANPSPSRRPALSMRSSQTSRTRSISNPVSNFLRGPGGVGSMGRNVRTIGPGNEKLTERFGAYLPSVAPPEHQTVFTPWTPSLISDTEGYTRTPVDANGLPIDTGGSIDLQDVGGAIEGWVRKLAKKASTALEASSTGDNAARIKGKGTAAANSGLGLGGNMGDLIELTDALDLGEGEVHPSEPLPSIELPSISPKEGVHAMTSAAAGSKSVNAYPGTSGEIRGRKTTKHIDEL